VAVPAIHSVPLDFHGDAFDPFSDDALEVTGEYLDASQPEPDLGSPVELGGQDTEANTLTVAASPVPGAVTQNLSGQSDSPAVVQGNNEGSISGSGSAAGSVNTGPHDGDTTVLSAMSTLGPSLAEGFLSKTSQSSSSPQTSGAGKVTLIQTSQKGLSLGANMVLFGVLAVLGFYLVKDLFE